MKFKDWHKVHEADDHAVFKNKHGHELKISKRSLSPQMLRDLQELPKRNFVYGSKEPKKYAAGGDVKPRVYAAAGWSDEEKAAFAAGARGEPVAHTTGAEQNQNVMDRAQPEQGPMSSPQPTQADSDRRQMQQAAASEPAPADTGSAGSSSDIQAARQHLSNFDEGGDVEPTASPDAPSGAPMPIAPNMQALQVGGMPPVPPSMQGPNSGDAPAPQAPQPQAPGAQPQDQQPQDAPQQLQPRAVGDMHGRSEPTLGDAYNAQINASNQGAKVEGKIANQQAAANAQSIQQQQNLYNDYQSKAHETWDNMQKFSQEVADQKIDYNRYLGNMTTGDKVRTSIGLILGGIAGGILHEENPAMKMLNSQIDRDIAQQQAQMGQKKTLYSANMDMYKNAKDAYDATSLQMHHVAGMQLQQAALASGSDLAKQRAQQFNAQLMSQQAPIFNQLNLNRTIMGVSGGQGGPNSPTPESVVNLLRQMDPEKAKEMESRMVPGLTNPNNGQTALAKIPVPDPVRQQLVDQQNLVTATQNLRNWISKNGTMMDKLSFSKQAEGEALAAELQQMYRKGVGASTSEEEQKIISGSIVPGSPTEFLARYTVDPRLKALGESMNLRLNNLKQNYGLPKSDPYLDWARQNPQNPKAQMYMAKMGVKH